MEDEAMQGIVRIRRLAAGLALVAGLCQAGERDWRLEVVLDTQAPAAERVAEIDRLRAAADAGSHPARCALGRVGLQRTLRPKDFPAGEYGDHVAYLNACVIGGDLDAMLVMAELELGQRRALEAMIWLQAYLKLAALFGTEAVNAAGSYKVGLIQRIERAYSTRRPSNEEVLEYVAGLLDSHGERIASGCEAGGCSWVRSALPANAAPLTMESGGRTLQGRFSRDYSSADESAQYATFLVRVDERGRPDQVLALDSFPNAKAAQRLAGAVRAGRYNAVPAGSGPRYLLVPIYVDNPDLKLVPDAPPNTRNRVRG
jgi:hypothetical protein